MCLIKEKLTYMNNHYALILMSLKCHSHHILIGNVIIIDTTIHRYENFLFIVFNCNVAQFILIILKLQAFYLKFSPFHFKSVAREN